MFHTPQLSSVIAVIPVVDSKIDLETAFGPEGCYGPITSKRVTPRSFMLSA